MTDLDVLLAAVLADPEDDLPRLAFADALEERGGPGDAARAEFVRAQVLLGVLDYYHDEAGVGRMMYRRGFTEVVECTAAEWKAHGRRLVREHPIRVVGLTGKEPIRHAESSGADWWEWPPGRQPDGLEAHGLPKWLWARLRGSSRMAGCYDTRDAAMDALSDACIAWAKSRPAPKRPRSAKT